MLYTQYSPLLTDVVNIIKVSFRLVYDTVGFNRDDVPSEKPLKFELPLFVQCIYTYSIPNSLLRRVSHRTRVTRKHHISYIFEL